MSNKAKKAFLIIACVLAGVYIIGTLLFISSAVPAVFLLPLMIAALLLAAAFLIGVSIADRRASGGGTADNSSEIKAAAERDTAVKNLLSGAFDVEECGLDEAGIRFEYSRFTVLVCAPDSTARLSKNSYASVLSELISSGHISRSGRIVYAVTMGGKHVAVLVNHGENSGLTDEELQSITNAVRDKFGTSVTVGIDTVTTTEEISAAYHNAAAAMEYRFVKGYGSVIHYSDIRFTPALLCEYPRASEKELLKAVSAKNNEAVIAAVEEYIRTVGEMPYNIIFLFTNRLAFAVFKLIPEHEAETSADIEFSAASMKDIGTLEGLKLYLLRICARTMKMIGAASETRQDILAAEIVEYIDANFKNPALTADMIADHAGKSVNYARAVFKQSQGVSISEYITRKRFALACELLRDTTLTAKAISDECGISSPNYFYTAFKRRMGETPEQYRKRLGTADK